MRIRATWRPCGADPRHATTTTASFHVHHRREIFEERYREALENVAFLTDAPYEMLTLVLERTREVLCPEGVYVYHR